MALRSHYLDLYSTELPPERLRLRSLIWEALKGRPFSDDLAGFFQHLRRRKFGRVFRAVYHGKTVDDFTLAQALSSYVTHVLIEIEMRQSDGHLYEIFSVSEAADLLSLYISGTVTSEDVREYVTLFFGPYLERLDAAVGAPA